MGYTQKMLCQNSSVMHFAFLIIFYIYNYKKMKRNRHLKNLHICKKGREKHAHLIINCTQVDFQTKRFWLCLKKKKIRKALTYIHTLRNSWEVFLSFLWRAVKLWAHFLSPTDSLALCTKSLFLRWEIRLTSTLSQAISAHYPPHTSLHLSALSKLYMSLLTNVCLCEIILFEHNVLWAFLGELYSPTKLWGSHLMNKPPSPPTAFNAL